MPQRKPGRMVHVKTGEESFDAFVPEALPPKPPIELDGDLLETLEKANRALGRLDGVSALLPDAQLFLYFYVRKEAVLSSQIEGTQSSLSDLLLFEYEEVPGVPIDDVVEVSNYVAAMEHGLSRLKELPVSVRLFREMHAKLLQGARGEHQNPGELRRSQNWIGGPRPALATFVPPPWEEVESCLADLERFLHDLDGKTPVLVKAALAHVQFETIHPFLDGNGRLGRLLITLLLCSEGALTAPMLYLSLYLKTHRSEYYAWLQRVRETGDWEGWLKFFLTGVKETADQAVDTVRRILLIFSEDRKKIESLGRAAGSALRIHESLQKRPITTVSSLVDSLNLTRPTVTLALKNLAELGLVKELTGRERHRLYSYQPYIDVLNQATEVRR